MIMMLPDLSAVVNGDGRQIEQTLLNSGYQKIGTAPRARFYCLPDADAMVMVSDDSTAMRPFLDMCQRIEGNPLLPVVYEHRTINDVHVAIMERLKWDFPDECQTLTLHGHAHAVSTFLTGDDIHGDVHRALACERAFLAASRGILLCMMDVIDKEKNVFPVYNAQPESVMFRECKKGIFPVYVAPVAARTDIAPCQAWSEIRRMERRLNALERQASSPPPPAP